MKITAGTIVRTIVLFLALVNQGLSMSGHPMLPIDDAVIEAAVTNLWTIGASLAAWWKNNSFTKSAMIGDQAMKRAKKDVKK